jgi:serine phosphatase RsbU (regulator of sigma subunit)
MFRDVRPSELGPTLRHDLQTIYRYYLDDERRGRLDQMGPLKRIVFVPIWILRSLLLKLTPARRLLLAIALVMGLLGQWVFRVGGERISIDYGPLAFLIILFVLMLELKDKLLAHDEIAVARQVQLALLPSSDPRPPGYSLWSHTRPANDVGGDLIDYLEDPLPRSLAVILGDVAGKGLGAALLMAKLQASLRATAPGCPGLADLGVRLNRTLFRDGLDNRFATLFYLELPRDGAGAARFLNAGHNPPLLVRASGIERIEPGGRPLGMFADSEYAEGRLEMMPSDLLIAYSDGLVEARNAEDAEFGLDRLIRMAPALRALEADEAGRLLLSEVDRFLAGARPHDDLSVVLVRRRPAD